MNLPGSKLISRLLGRKPEQVAPATPEAQTTPYTPERVITSYAPGAIESLEGAKTAEALGKLITADVLRQTGEAGITKTMSPQRGRVDFGFLAC